MQCIRHICRQRENDFDYTLQYEFDFFLSGALFADYYWTISSVPKKFSNPSWTINSFRDSNDYRNFMA